MEQGKYHIFDSLEDLEPSDQKLIEAAINALPLSYAPYSTFHVACAIRLQSGEIVTGVNQENASSPAGLCAEQVALHRKAMEFPEGIIAELAVVARTEESKELHSVSPCGICRQAMLEFLSRQGSSFPVLMKSDGNSWIRVKEMESLLPFGFTSNSR